MVALPLVLVAGCGTTPKSECAFRWNRQALEELSKIWTSHPNLADAVDELNAECCANRGDAKDDPLCDDS